MTLGLGRSGLKVGASIIRIRSWVPLQRSVKGSRRATVGFRGLNKNNNHNHNHNHNNNNNRVLEGMSDNGMGNQ